MTTPSTAPRQPSTPSPMPTLSWTLRALDAIKAIPSGTKGLGEDFRLEIVDAVGVPGHPNAWGGLFRAAVQRGLLKHTGAFAPMKNPKSHGRQSPVLVRT